MSQLVQLCDAGKRVADKVLAQGVDAKHTQDAGATQHTQHTQQQQHHRNGPEHAKTDGELAHERIDRHE